MMMDADVVAVSPSSVYRTLKRRDLLGRWNHKRSKKGQGFRQPSKPHEHWHTDISHINICGTFYYLCALLDGYSRYIVHWELRESMTEGDVETIIQRAREKYPEARLWEAAEKVGFIVGRTCREERKTGTRSRQGSCIRTRWGWNVCVWC